MIRVVLASQNVGKLTELQQLIAAPNLELVSPSSLGIGPEFDVAETGSTFRENSYLKAAAFAAKTDHPALADDSGLIVDALDGFPGVHSKRFIDGGATARNQAIIAKLAQLGPGAPRTASFTCVLCFVDPTRTLVQYCEGKVTGTIAHTEQGTQGFDYDRIFIPDGYDQTFSQLGPLVKQQRSHRAEAAKAFAQFWKETYGIT